MRYDLPIYLLIVVAIVQLILAHTKDLSPWKGGGFGMFSTVDYPSARKLRVYVISESSPKFHVHHKKYKNLEKSFRTLPTKKRFDEIAQRIAQIVTLDHKTPKDARFLIVQYWKHSYSSETGRLHKKLIFPKKVRLLK